MERAKVVEGLIGYFKSDHWRRLVAALMEDPDPRGTHVHAYVETCVQPAQTEELICGYFAARGMPSARKIDYVAPREDIGSIHAVEPLGRAHFDFNWFYNPSVVLAGTRGAEMGESGSNLCVWNRAYIREFYSDYPFRPVGPAEEEALRSYFRSDHWHRGLELCTLPTTTHGHINCYVGVHPDVIRRFAEEALAEKGWKISYTCPNVYRVWGGYTGKLVFMGTDPEWVYDLGWVFKPDVVIEPAWDTFWLPDHPGYDLWTTAHLVPILGQPYVKLADREIQAILDAVATAVPVR
ncbi:MAG: hypothetical protein HY331_15260 [Chloroflexi bacterium]|nr:hypothetical protein [Chloroflexota bacterium]